MIYVTFRFRCMAMVPPWVVCKIIQGSIRCIAVTHIFDLSVNTQKSRNLNASKRFAVRMGLSVAAFVFVGSACKF